MDKKVKVCVVGVGGIGRYYLSELKKIKDAEITAICDISESTVKKVAEEFGIKNTFTDYKKMFKSIKSDAVIIGTPNKFHAPITIEAIKNGCHVLVEKPMAMNTKEARLMVESAEKSKKILMIGHQLRFSRTSQFIKEYIESGELGEIYYAKCGYLRQRGIPGRPTFLDKSLSGGGALIDIGVHILDLTLWLLGFPIPVSVNGSVYTKLGFNEEILGWGFKGNKNFKVDDLACALIKFKNGLTLLFDTSWASNRASYINDNDLFYFEFFGTKAGLYSGNWMKEIMIFEGKGKRVLSIRPTNLGYYEELEKTKYFIDCIKNNKQPTIAATGPQGLTIMQIIEAIYESSKTSKEVKI